MTTVESTTYDAPGHSGSPVELEERYENFIGGEWIAPSTGEYRDNLTPSTGEPFCEVAHSGAEDIELCARRRARGQGRVGPPLAGRARRGPERDR